MTRTVTQKQLVTVHTHPGSKLAFISCNNVGQKTKNHTTQVMLNKVKSAVVKKKAGSNTTTIYHDFNNSFSQAAVATNYTGWAEEITTTANDLNHAQKIKDTAVAGLTTLGYTVVGRESISKILYSTGGNKNTNWGSPLPKTESTLRNWVGDFLKFLGLNGYHHNHPKWIEDLIIFHVFNKNPLPTSWRVKQVKDRGDIFDICCQVTGAPF